MVMINYSFSSDIIKIQERYSKPSNEFGHICYETLNTSEKINFSIGHRYSSKSQIQHS